MTDAPAPRSADVRVSTLIGDRLCIKCGYNLVGQPILRESHYDMLIIRCPECATVASVQEYPLLGRWANRWAALLAALWLLVLMTLWFGTSAAMFGFGVGSAEMAADHYGEILFQRFNQWQMQQQALAANAANSPTPSRTGPSGQLTVTSGGGQVVFTGNMADFASWWKAQDQAALLREAGGVFGGFSWYVWYLWMWLTIVGVSLGVMWATLLIARGRTGLLAWCGIIVLTAAALGLIPVLDWISNQPGWTGRAAEKQIGPTVLALTLLWGGLCLGAGMMVGRPIARGLVRLMLPPRMRSSLAFLWLTDGLDPPSARQSQERITRRG